MKRIYIYILAGGGVIILAVIVALALAINQRSTIADKLPKDQRTVLTVWRPIDDEEVFDSIIARYEEKNPHIKIRYIKKDLENYELDSINAIAAEKSPDIWSIPNSWLPRHQDKLFPMPDGLLASTKEQKKDPQINAKKIRQAFVPVVAEEAVIDGRVYGMPLFVDSLALIVNPKLVEQALIELGRDQRQKKTLLRNGPQYWDEFIAFSRLLTKKQKDQIIQAGTALGTPDNITNSADILAVLMLQVKTQMNSSDRTQATFNLPSTKTSGEATHPGQNALNFYTRFAAPQGAAYTWNSQMPNDLTAFSQGRVAMVFAYSSQIQNLLTKNPDLEYLPIALPQIRGSKEAIDLTNYWFETVPLNAPHPQEAWNFILYLNQQGVHRYLSQTKRPSPYKIQAPEINRRLRQGNPWSFQQQTGKSWYRGPEPQRVTQIFKQMIRAVNEGQSLQNALDQAAAQVTATFREE
jgi:ABC-type glycerol-3-phosphate transport system substrate-binding protein